MKTSKKNWQRPTTILLAKQLKTTTPRLHANVSNDFELSNVSEEVIKKILLSFNTSKDPEMEKIPAKFLRDCAEVLTLPLRNTIDLLTKLSNFPKEWKIAKLKPIFKRGARTDPKNYRPIPLLPLVSETIKKSIHLQIETT